MQTESLLGLISQPPYRGCIHTLADLEGGGGGFCNPPPFQISKIKESNKTKEKKEDNTLEKEDERKSCMCV